MKYIGLFKDINNTSYKIEIITNNDSTQTKSLILNSTPLIVKLLGSEEHIFKPVKYSSCTIGAVVKDYHFDLYSSKAQQNNVTIYKENNIIWKGYVTPNLYNTTYENIDEEIEIECISALSTLQYYEYETNEKSIISFIDLINKILLKCNAYERFYISDNISLNELDLSCLSSKLYISEQNFFDEDDKPMKYDEVLEELCKYLNVTCVELGTSVYFIDYEAIKNGNNFYWEYNLGSNQPIKKEIISRADISQQDYTSNGGQISLDNTYNKATVTCSLYTAEKQIPDLWDNKLLTNQNGDNYMEYFQDEINKELTYLCYFKYYSHKYYKSYYYSRATQMPASPEPILYDDLKNYIGATIVKHKTYKDDGNILNKVNLDDYLLISCHDKLPLNTDIRRKVFELSTNPLPPNFAGKDAYLVIKGGVTYMDQESIMYLPTEHKRENDNFDPVNLFIWARLKYGDYYWDGFNWVTLPSDFRLYFDAKGDSSHLINKQFPVRNNIDWRMHLDEEGYSIKLPRNEGISFSKPEFTLFQPQRVAADYRCDAVWINNFDIVTVLKHQESENPDDEISDTEYSNIINDDFVSELQPIEFKICTWDDKDPNYSCVCYKNGNIYSFLDKTYNKWEHVKRRMEEHYINKLVSQYKDPCAILELNLKNIYDPYTLFTDKYLPGKCFILDSYEIDFEYNKISVKLIEKK